MHGHVATSRPQNFNPICAPSPIMGSAVVVILPFTERPLLPLISLSLSLSLESPSLYSCSSSLLLAPPHAVSRFASHPLYLSPSFSLSRNDSLSLSPSLAFSPSPALLVAPSTSPFVFLSPLPLPPPLCLPSLELDTSGSQGSDNISLPELPDRLYSLSGN